MTDINEGITINGALINNFWYADDTVFVSSSVVDKITYLGSTLNRNLQFKNTIRIEKVRKAFTHLKNVLWNPNINNSNTNKGFSMLCTPVMYVSFLACWESSISMPYLNKLQYAGRIMRGPKYRLMQLIRQGKIWSSQGPCRTSWFKNSRQWIRKTSIALFRAAGNKNGWARMITNVEY